MHAENNNYNKFVPMSDIALTSGKTYTMTMTVKGSGSGKLDGRVGDWGGGANFSINFNTEWNDVQVEVKPTMDNNFILLHVPNYVGDVYIKNIKFEGYEGETRPLTQEERHDTLVWAMDKWIKGMMEACDGKVKAWDLVNKAISGGDNDKDGYYDLQSPSPFDTNKSQNSKCFHLKYHKIPTISTYFLTKFLHNQPSEVKKLSFPNQLIRYYCTFTSLKMQMNHIFAFNFRRKC